MAMGNSPVATISIAAELDQSSWASLESAISSKIKSIESSAAKIKIQFDTASIQQAVNQLNSAMASIRTGMTGASSSTVSSSASAAAAAAAKEEANATNQSAQADAKKAASAKQASQAEQQKATAARNAATAENQEATATNKNEQAMRKYNTTLQRATNDLKKYSAAQNSSSKETREAYAGIEQQVEQLKAAQTEFEATGDLSKFNSQISTSQTALSTYETQIKSTDDATKSLGDRFSGLASKFTMWFSASQSIMLAVRSIREMISASIELDSAMAQLKIVTDETDESYAKFGDDIAKTAQDIGASITDLIDSTTTYARLGYNMEESSMLAEYTSMLKNVGDIQVDQAQEAVTSIVKAFDVNVDDIEGVMDKLVAVGNNFPISVSEIAEGMTNASSSLAAAGNTFEQSVALLTAANTTIQDISRSSTGLRTIVARLRNTKTELDELGEDMSTAKYEELISALTDANVALTDQNGEYRATYLIMQDIAHEWDNLSSMEQASLAQTIAGTRQQAVFYSLVEQFQEAEGAMDTMAESNGTLMESYDVIMDTTQRHINTFKAAFQELGSDLFQSSFLSGLVDMGTGILNVIDKIVQLTDKIGGLKTVLIAAGAAFAILKFDTIKSSITKISDSFRLFGMQVQESVSKAVSQVKLLGSTLKTDAQLSSTSAIGTFFTAFPAAGAVAGIAGVTAAIIAMVAAIEYSNHAYTRAQEEAEQTLQAYRDEQEQLDSLQSEYDETQSRIEELNALKLDGTISLSEEAELDNLKAENEELALQIKYEESLVKLRADEASAAATRASTTGESYLEYLEGEGYSKIQAFFTMMAEGMGMSGYNDYTPDLVNWANAGGDAVAFATDKVDEFKDAYDDARAALNADPTSADAWATYQNAADDLNAAIDGLEERKSTIQGWIEAWEAAGGHDDEIEYWTNQIKELDNAVMDLTMEPAEKQFTEIDNFLKDVDTEGVFTDIFAQAIDDGVELEGVLEELGYSFSDIGDDIDEDAMRKYFIDATNSAKDAVDMMAVLQDAFSKNKLGGEYDTSTYDSLMQWAGSLSDEDLKLVYQISLDNNTALWDLERWQEELEQVKQDQTLSFTIDIDAETTSLENLNTAMSESRSESGLTADSIANLKDRYSVLGDAFDDGKLFENTTEGIHLNREALQELEEQYDEFQMSGLNAKLNEQVAEYAAASLKLQDLDEGTAEYYATLADVSSLESQIHATEQLISQYEGLTSAYGKWQDALSSTDENAEFKEIGDQYDNMKAILDQGWYGNDDLNAYLDLMLSAHERTGDAVTDFNKLTQTIDGTNHSLMDYFTYEDGNLVTDGLYDFIDDVNAIFGDEYAGWDEESGYYLNLAGDRAEEVAERFGTSAEFIQEIGKALAESGMDIQLGDSILDSITDLDELAEAAENAADSVNDIVSDATGLDFEINYDTEDTDELQSEIDSVKEAYDGLVNEDGTVNFEAEGADELAESITTLTLQKQQLEEEGNILLNMDTSACEEGVGQVVSLMQEFQGQYDNLELQSNLNLDTSSAESGIQTIAAELSTFSDEQLKVALNLDDAGVEELRAALAELTGEEWTAEASVNVDDSALEVVESAIKDYDINVNTNATGDTQVSVTAETSQVDSAIESIKSEIASISTDPIQVEVDTSQVDSAIAAVTSSIQSITADPITITADTSQVDSAVASISSEVQSINADPVQITADSSQAEATISAVEAMTIPDKTFSIIANDQASGTIGSIQTSLSGLSDKTITITTNYVTTGKKNGEATAQGTAQANGTALPTGNWSVGRSERALMGELGPEMVVRDGKFFTVGDAGAEFVDLQPDDIVFNHLQTEMLLNSGRVPGRGLVVGNDDSLAQGSAYSSSSVTGSGGQRRTSSTTTTTTTKTTTTSSGSSSGSSSKSSSSSKSTSTSSSSSSSSKSSSSSSTEADDYEKTFDWIEIKIDRLERAIDSLDLKMSSTYKTWSTRNSNLSSEISNITDEINLQQKAYDRYIQQANSVGLSSYYADLVKNGAIDISTITDEDLADKISEYQKWWFSFVPLNPFYCGNTPITPIRYNVAGNGERECGTGLKPNSVLVA